MSHPSIPDGRCTECQRPFDDHDLSMWPPLCKLPEKT